MSKASSHSLSKKNDHYFVPHQSNYSLPLSLSVFVMALGFILQINKVGMGTAILIAGFVGLLLMTFRWFAEVAGESLSGQFSRWEDRSFRIGMQWFIFSEVMFFAAFFGALYYFRRISVPELAHFDPAFTPYPEFTAQWPSAGPKGNAFTPMGAWGIPAINTLLLLSSGVTLTIAHWGLLKNKKGQLVYGLAATIILGLIFLCLQAYEYHHAYAELGLTLGAGVYGASFYMLTGFHGFHVTLGTIMLIVIWIRSIKGHFTVKNHFGFEAVAWYWHFVDVVWLLLFVLVYWL